MNFHSRHPLAPLSSALPKPRVVSGTKRSRSPDVILPNHSNAPKRQRATGAALPVTLSPARLEKRARKLQEKEEKEAEFKDKYTRAFRAFSFYFDTDQAMSSKRRQVESRILQLGGSIEGFFSKNLTHLISNKQVDDEKENATKLRPTVKSPLKHKSRVLEDISTPVTYDLVAMAKSFDIKIWSFEKLVSVLDRCLTPTTSTRRSLSHLLHAERINGTSERDPTQRRHDFRYFAKGSYFVLVEDMCQNLATIATQEFTMLRGRDGSKKPPWPVLHCHPLSRGPFIEFDDKERRRWEKAMEADRQQRDANREDVERAVIKQKARAQKSDLLRRTVSLNNLRRNGPLSLIDVHGIANLSACGNQESANASGYLLDSSMAGYVAASGNSVGITSTIGTTTTTGAHSFESKLPSNLRALVQQEVVTSRKMPTAAISKHEEEYQEIMGPPAAPNRVGLLKKSRSTNTLKADKDKRHRPARRDEGSKPGYCENCRVKFDDFSEHVKSRKHRKYANDDAHFFSLDAVLARLVRRTVQQVEEARLKREDYFENGSEYEIPSDTEDQHARASSTGFSGIDMPSDINIDLDSYDY